MIAVTGSAGTLPGTAVEEWRRAGPEMRKASDTPSELIGHQEFQKKNRRSHAD